MVITGKDDGNQGTILQVIPAKPEKKNGADADKVIVSGVNTASKHMKPGRHGRNSLGPRRRRTAAGSSRDRHADRREQRGVRPQGQAGAARLRASTRTARRCASPSSGAGKTEVIS